MGRRTPCQPLRDPGRPCWRACRWPRGSFFVFTTGGDAPACPDSGCERPERGHGVVWENAHSAQNRHSSTSAHVVPDHRETLTKPWFAQIVCKLLSALLLLSLKLLLGISLSLFAAPLIKVPTFFVICRAHKGRSSRDGKLRQCRKDIQINQPSKDVVLRKLKRWLLLGAVPRISKSVPKCFARVC